MPLPSSMAWRMVEKSSSVNIMSDASLATSVPCRPMAMPMSAFFSAGASLTPSPVMATMSPRDWSARMIFILWSGFVRAKMVVVCIAWARASSDISSTSSPRSTGRTLTWFGPCSWGFAMDMPSCLPIATAVVSASPVIMMTRTPPRINFLMARPTPGLGGSRMPTRPAKVRPLYTSSETRGWTRSEFCVVAGFRGGRETGPLAKAKTRSPWTAMVSAAL